MEMLKCHCVNVTLTLLSLEGSNPISFRRLRSEGLNRITNRPLLFSIETVLSLKMMSFFSRDCLRIILVISASEVIF